MLNEFLTAYRASGRRLQGTDGVRGVVDPVELHYPEALETFIRVGRITPAFVELSCRAFARICLRQKLVRARDTVCFADDGRDFFGEKLLRTAAMQGLAEEGLAVRDIGVAPTPGAVIFAAYADLRLTVVLTASHNPSNQNGLKFFIDGYKLLPTGTLSDTTLTQEMFALADGLPKQERRKRNTESARMSVRRRAAGQPALQSARRANLAAGLAILPPVNWPLAAVEVVFDPANGAGLQYGLDLLQKLGVTHRVVNGAPNGQNINQNGGVGEIEGHAAFHGQHRPAGDLRQLPVVKQVMLRGRANGEHIWTVGLVLDGDGDRGYLLVYVPDTDSVCVVAGDQLAYILAALDYNRGSLPQGGYFVTTVEGDLMAPLAASRNLQLRTKLTCVGDKWLTLPARNGEPIAVAAEESGHVIRTLPVSTAKGGMHYVNTGNGLLAVMGVIAGVLAGEYPPDRVVQPYPPGFKQAAYTYFVDKELFQPGAEGWEATAAMIEAMLKGALGRATGPNGQRLDFRRQNFPEDPGMLYYAVVEGSQMVDDELHGEVVASIFVRNSGTENKTSINIRGRTVYFGLMQAMLEKIHAAHLKMLKDPRLFETQIEARVLAQLKQKAAKTAGTLLKRLNDEGGVRLKRVDLDAVLYALRKERRVKAGEPIFLA